MTQLPTTVETRTRSLHLYAYNPPTDPFARVWEAESWPQRTRRHRTCPPLSFPARPPALPLRALLREHGSLRAFSPQACARAVRAWRALPHVSAWLPLPPADGEFYQLCGIPTTCNRAWQGLGVECTSGLSKLIACCHPERGVFLLREPWAVQPPAQPRHSPGPLPAVRASVLTAWVPVPACSRSPLQ